MTFVSLLRGRNVSGFHPQAGRIGKDQKPKPTIRNDGYSPLVIETAEGLIGPVDPVRVAHSEKVAETRSARRPLPPFVTEQGPVLQRRTSDPANEGARLLNPDLFDDPDSFPRT